MNRGAQIETPKSFEENFYFDFAAGVIVLEDGRIMKLADPFAFDLISSGWLRAGWDAKYVYSFSWMGRPIIQLPEDLIRLQEVIYDFRPDVIVETGVAHGGSLVFYASLFEACGHGRVIGVDIEIRPHNRDAILAHRLAHRISLVTGSSTDAGTFDQVSKQISGNEKVMVILDSNHSRPHVLRELEIYSALIGLGGIMVACDGIMSQLRGAPRSMPDWDSNNPVGAVSDFLASNKNFVLFEPEFPFNEGSVQSRVTYWPHAFLRRIGAKE